MPGADFHGLGFRVLGPVEVHGQNGTVPLGGTKQKAVLANLILNVGRVVSSARLIDGVWGEDPPISAAHSVESYVSRIRQALRSAGLDGVHTRSPGYVLAVEPETVDFCRFDRLVADADAASERGDAEQEALTLASALALWRGPALADVLDAPFAAAAARRLNDLRLAVVERRVDADLHCGRHRQLIPELEVLVAAEPYWEAFHRQLVLALYRSGRQADALAAYRRARTVLVEDLGIEPGAELRAIEGLVLRQDATLDPPPVAAAPVDSVDARSLVDITIDGAQGRAEVAAGLRRRKRLTIAALAVTIGVAAVVIPFVTGGRNPAVEVATNGVIVLGTDGGDLVVEASLDLEGPPGQLAVGEGSVWVSSPEGHAVHRIDPDRHTVQSIPVGSGADGLVVGAGAAWIANSLDGTVSRIDLETNKVIDTITVGSQPSGIAFGDGMVWIADPVAGVVTRINPATDRPERTTSLEIEPFALAIGDDTVWATSAVANRVLAIDAASRRTIHSVGVGGGPTAIALGFGSAWVANSRDSTVSRIDPANGSVLATIPVGAGPTGIAVGEDAVWVSSEHAGSVTQIDPVRDRVVRSIAVGGRPRSVGVVDNDVWVTMRPAPTEDRRGGTLRAEAPVPTSIDPAVMWPASLFQLWSYTYDTLVTFQRVGGSAGQLLVPDLAVAIPRPAAGGRKYTFVIRPGIRYSDGSPVRAADFRYALERTLDLNDQGASTLLQGIEGASACAMEPSVCDLSEGITVDETSRSVTFQLREPDPNFLYKLALPFASPVPPTTPRSDVGSNPVPATGPYLFAEYHPNRSLRLERNPAFREWSAAAQPDGYPDRIEWRFGAPQSDAIAAVERGESDWTGVFPVDTRTIAPRARSQVHVDPSLTTFFFFFNTRAPPFDDIRVRQAVNLAIDRSAVVEILGGPTAALPACQLFPPGMPGHRPYCPYTVQPTSSGTWIAADLVRARELIESSGTAGMSVTIWSSDLEPVYEPLSQHVASVLADLGYASSVRTLPHDAFVDFVSDSRNGAQMGPNVWTADYPSPANFYDFFLACAAFVPADPAHNSNGSEFCDPQLDRQAQAAATLQPVDPQQATALWEQVGQRVTDLAPVLPLGYARSVSLVSSRVTNYQYNPVWGVIMDQLSVIDRAHPATSTAP